MLFLELYVTLCCHFCSPMPAIPTGIISFKLIYEMLCYLSNGL